MSTPKKLKITDQTAEKEYKSSIRMQPHVNATSQSPLVDKVKTNIKMHQKYHHSVETNQNGTKLYMILLI
jgi:hypothetical protein